MELLAGHNFRGSTFLLRGHGLLAFVTTVLNQTAVMGDAQRAAHGAYQIVNNLGEPVTGVTDAGTGTATSTNYTLSAGGLIAPAANGSFALENGNTININSDQGSCTVTLDVRANALVIAPQSTTTELATAVSFCSGTPATNWTVYLRPGTFGNIGTKFSTGVRMSGSISHANLDAEGVINDPSTYVYGDTATIVGGSIRLTPVSAPVTWNYRTQLNGANGFIFDGIDMISGQNLTPNPSITGGITTLGDHVFKGGSIRGGSTKGKGFSINGARHIVIEDFDITDVDTPIADLSCTRIDTRRLNVWAYIDDGYATRNEQISILGNVTMYRQMDNTVITDRATGVSHADNWQLSATQNQLPHRLFVAKSIFGRYAQGLFIGDLGNTMSIIVDGLVGTLDPATTWTYGASNSLYVRTINDIGGGQYRINVTRGLANGPKGDFSMPFPVDNETLTNGANTMQMVGNVTKPLIYSGVVFDNWYFGDFGQGFGVPENEFLLVNNSIIRWAGPGANTSADAFMNVSGALGKGIATKNLGKQLVLSGSVLANNVELNAKVASGATSYPVVFDASDKTFALNADTYVEASVDHPLNEPATLKAYLEATYATTQDVGAGKPLDWTKPVLSSGTTTSISTTIGNGRLFYVVDASGLTLDAFQIANDSAGWSNGLKVPAASSGFSDVTATGVQTPSPAPTVGAGQSIYWCHVAAGGGISAVVEVVGA